MKKDAVLAASIRLFAERGFGNTPTSLIAKEAGVAEGTIFRHFKNKDEIFLLLIRSVHAHLINDIEKYLDVRSPETGLERVISVFKSFYVFVKKNRVEFGLVFRDAPSHYGQSDDDFFLIVKAMHEFLAAQIRQGITEGQQDGSINETLNVNDTTCILVGAMFGISHTLELDFLKGSEDMLKHSTEAFTAILHP